MHLRKHVGMVSSGAAAIGLVIFGVVLLSRGSSYTINAHFVSGGRLVVGGLVEVAGRPVGRISNITLTSNGEASAALSIDDANLSPLHVGTRASIRAVGQGEVDENFVLVTPGPADAPVIPSGGVLPISQTSSIVDIDALLDSFGPTQRASLDELIANSASIYAGSGARYFNGLVAELAPSFGALEGFSSSLSLDRGELRELVETASQAAGAVASRSPDLTAAVTHTARTLDAIATQRQSLSDLLSRLPTFIVQARGTLARADTTLTALRPTLRAVVPVAQPLRALLTRLTVTLPQAGPVLGQLRSEIPALDRSLIGLAPLARPAVSALRTLGPAMKGLFPIARGLRVYGADIIIGSLATIFGSIAGEYNGFGHYGKANFVQPLQTLPAGALSTLLASHPLVPGLLAVRTGLTRRCPGGSQPPAPDGSSPWNVGPALCSASDDESLSVDFP